MAWFSAITLGGWFIVVGVALGIRGRQFAMFVGILVGVYGLLALAMVPTYPPLRAVFAAFHVTVYLNYLMLARPRMRSLPYRLLITWPSSIMTAGTLLALPWGLAVAFGFHPWAPWLPYVLGVIGIAQSFGTRREQVNLVVAGPSGPRAEVLAPHPRGDHRQQRPLRIVQITDPHLGPFMSVARLSAIAARAVAEQPDLVLLTGDFLTMESHSDPDLLRDAMAPFAAFPGRVFACHGNHDHEALEVVARAMRENGVTLLVDNAIDVETGAGPVQIVGSDFVWRDRAGHLARLAAKHPRKPGALRIVMLHDPAAFRHLPDGDGDLVLSGHTHGGQVGFVSLGLQWTFLRMFRTPDHGFWARGSDRMYVHRGTGHYGFPVRLGVPAEESVLHVHRHDAP